jgi:uncharacterized protein YycO
LDKLNYKLGKDLTKVTENITDVKVELNTMMINKEKKKIGNALSGDGGFIQMTCSKMSKKIHKHHSGKHEDKDQIVEDYKQHPTMHCKKHNRQETKEMFVHTHLG